MPSKGSFTALAHWEAPAGLMMLGQQLTIVFVRPAQNKAAVLQEAYDIAQLLNTALPGQRQA